MLGRRASSRHGSWGPRRGRFLGATPVSELLAWIDENERDAGRDHFLRAYRAGSLAMLGRFDEARAILAEARAEQAERGGGILLANITAFESVWVELWAGDPAAAAEFGAEGWRLHEELGEPGFLAAAAANLAQALYALDRLDDADAWAARAVELGASDDVRKEMLWRQVRAKVLARRGEHAEAERLAREAVAICEETDMLDAQGDVYADLAEVLLLGGKLDEAAAALEQALERYERKGTASWRSACRHASPSSTASEYLTHLSRGRTFTRRSTPYRGGFLWLVSSRAVLRFPLRVGGRCGCGGCGLGRWQPVGGHEPRPPGEHLGVGHRVPRSGAQRRVLRRRFCSRPAPT